MISICDTPYFFRWGGPTKNIIFGSKIVGNISYFTHPANLIFYLDEHTNTIQSKAITMNHDKLRPMSDLEIIKQDEENNYFIYIFRTGADGLFWGVRVPKKDCLYLTDKII